MYKTNQKGIAQVLFLLAVVGLVAFLLISSSGGFKSKTFSSIFNINKSRAASTITKKVLLVIYDPILANGQKLHQTQNWNDPMSLDQQVIAAINEASSGNVNYQIVETSERNEWPRKKDGFVYDETSYLSCISNNSTCHQPDEADYAKMWSDLDIANKFSSGQIDAVFVWSFPYSGFDEYAFRIPHDQVPFNQPTDINLYSSRIKNIPDTNGKTVLVMGWNYERGVAEAIHSYGHWVEDALALTVGRGYWNGCRGTSDFDKYTCIAKDITPTTPIQQAGCGSVHFPFNGTVDYDYANMTNQSTICASWYDYPFTTPTTFTLNCTEFACTQLEYLKWWLGYIPHQGGVTDSGNLRNWWKYIADFDNAVIEMKAALPSPSPSPSPTPRPTPTPTPPPSFLNITSPNNGGNFIAGKPMTISWDYYDATACIISARVGSSQVFPVTNINAAVKTYSWIINIGSQTPGSAIRTKIEMSCIKKGGGILFDTSDVPFVVSVPGGCSQACLSDVNTNGLSNTQDYSILRACFGLNESYEFSSGVSCLRTDINKDGSIDTNDYNCMKTTFGQLCTTPNTTDGWSSPLSKRIFVTSRVYQSYVGTNGADMICQSSAINSGISGVWKAWLSDSTHSASGRLNHYSGLYKLLNDKTVANNWSNLISGNIQSPINVDELGRPRANTLVWTGSLQDGSSSANDCSAWSSDSLLSTSTATATVGSSSDTGSGWTNKQTNPCNINKYPLYCIEQ